MRAHFLTFFGRLFGLMSYIEEDLYRLFKKKHFPVHECGQQGGFKTLK